MTVLVGAICLLAGMVIGGVIETIRRPSWAEPSTHDLGILPGGFVIHHSTCWCKQ